MRNGIAACCVVAPTAPATRVATDRARKNASVRASAPRKRAIAIGTKKPGAYPRTAATVAQIDAANSVRRGRSATAVGSPMTP
ncbi:MAG TPA: hypothetical protein VHU82_16155 [Vicinamibacterales bacterium]|nr:hypothetical protein [Vicinamibacterales bacterium]